MSTALNRHTLIARGVSLLALGAAVLVVVLLVSGGSSYQLKLQLANASGLRPGSQVLLGGVAVGNVKSLDLNRQNVVVATLDLNPKLVRVGQGASASIVAANLLGEKYVSLQPGNPKAALPSGASLPPSATTPSTDLDQIVAVLDDPTRADLAILLNEAGRAVAGRRNDVGAILRQFPLSLSAATQLLTTMVQDNHTLADLVANSNQFITRVNAQSGDLKQVIDAGAGAVTTLAQRTAQLRQTVAGLPGVARSFTNTFVEGRNAIAPLIPAADQIANAAPELDSLLRAVGPFTTAAVPTLNRAAAISPTLENLAFQATPTVAQALPTLSSLQNLARLAVPLTSWAGLSSHDLFNIFAGWTRAIQFRDGLSHIFNGDLYFSPAIVLNIANQGATATQRRQNLLDILSPDVLRTLGLQGAADAARAAGGHATPPSSTQRQLSKTGSAQRTSTTPGGPGSNTGTSSATSTTTTTTSTTTTPSSGGSWLGLPIGNLLSYLLGK